MNFSIDQLSGDGEEEKLATQRPQYTCDIQKQSLLSRTFKQRQRKSIEAFNLCIIAIIK